MFRRIVLFALGALVATFLSGARLEAQQNVPQNAQQTEPRIAFVVGNAAYAPGALPATLNDAGLVAEALRSIGFEIVEGADLSQADLVRTYREFLAKVDGAGPDTLAFVYFSGHALSFEGENYLLGVDARLPRDSDIPIEGVRLSDLMRPLADSPARAKVVIIDAMRPLPFRPQGKPLAHGLEAIDPPSGMLVAYASAPGTVAPDQPGNYGPYATAIAEMLRAPGTDLETVFTHIRSRTHLTTEGRQTPWDASALGEQIELLPPEAATASVPPPPPIRQARPMREIGADEAYALAIEMDTLEGYTGFVQAYPGHPYAKRVWAMIRARREALAWMRALEINTPQSYWTYLRRYPNGMYAFDAERRLRRLGAAGGPPPGFAMMEFDDVPMALSGEPVEYEEVYRVGPPPPRILYGAPRPAYLVNLPPPQRRGGGAGSRILPALAVAIPLVAALAPAPRRAVAPGAPGAGGGGNRQGGFGARGGNRNPSAAAPASVTPNQAVTPAPVTPNAAVAPSTVTPSTATPTAPGGNRPPGWGPGGTRPPGVADRPPGGAAPAGAAAPATGAPSAAITPNSAAPKSAAPSSTTPSTAKPSTATPSPGGPLAPGSRRPPGGGPPPGIANRTPPAAAPPAAAPNSAAPSSAKPGTPPAPAAGRPPGRPPGPPPGIANRTPPSAPPQPAAPVRPSGPPPQVNRPPPPPHPAPAAVARPTPPAAPVAAPPRPAPPPRPAAAAAARPPAPPPPRPAAPPPKPPACPAGKTLKVVNGAPTCS